MKIVKVREHNRVIRDTENCVYSDNASKWSGGVVKDTYTVVKVKRQRKSKKEPESMEWC